jgi:hypothetical protein
MALALDPSTEFCRTQQFFDAEEEEKRGTDQDIMKSEIDIHTKNSPLIRSIIYNMIDNIYSRTNANISEQCITRRIMNEIYVFSQFVEIRINTNLNPCTISSICDSMSKYHPGTLREFEAYVKLGGGFNQTIYTMLMTSSLQERKAFLVLGG